MTQLCSVVRAAAALTARADNWALCSSGRAHGAGSTALRRGISGTRQRRGVFLRLQSAACLPETAPSAAENTEKEITVAQLSDFFLRLRDEGARRQPVTPSHHTRQTPRRSRSVPLASRSCGTARATNASSRCACSTGLCPSRPDLKYALSGPAARYFRRGRLSAGRARRHSEMYRQTGPFRLDDDGMLQRGVLIRHLILPQQGENTRRVIDWVGQTFAPGQVLFSLMSQYTPVGDLAQWPELQQPVSPRTE